MKVKILVPIYNDWQSASKLLDEIDNNISDLDHEISVIIVNDASTHDRQEEQKDFNNIQSIKILNMKINQGHARCIATGLKYIFEKEEFDYVIPMDGDGEDRPEEIPQFVEKILKNPDIPVVGKRVKRLDNNVFKFCYEIHKISTYLFTGKLIKFGNFTCISKSVVKKMINEKATWNCYSASLVKITKIRDSIPSIRGKRYFDLSKMSFYNLIIHSFSIISVFKINVLIRSIGFIILYTFLIKSNFSIVTSIPIVLVIIFVIAIFKLSKRENMEEYNKCLDNISNIEVFEKS